MTNAGELPEDLLRLAFDRSPAGITVSGLDGRWLRINAACGRMLGYAQDEIAGVAGEIPTHPDDVHADREFVAAALAGERDSLEREKRYVRRDGSTLWVRILSYVIRDDAGSALYFVSHIQDVSDRRHAQELLHDSEQTLRSVIDNTPAMISVKDRDHRYKLVNREFAQQCGMSGRQIVGRVDSELLPPSTIAEVHARDREVLEGGENSREERTVLADGRERTLLITRFPLRDEAGVIHGVCAASIDITERRVEERSKLEYLQCSALIGSALAEDRFVLHAQPIVHLASMKASKAELLIRMRKPDGAGELVAPAAFLPAAERLGLISVIDDWTINHAIDLAAAGRRVSVNVSAKTISNPHQLDQIEARLTSSGAPPANLIFEITETAVADNLDAARDFAIRMRALGCAIALDDFGVGHGSFTYLRHLPLDYLKIDMQFVRDLLGDEEDRQVVQAIIGVAYQFNIETIAEGVEDEETLTLLRRLGVDYVQGYLTGRPMPLNQCWNSVEYQTQGGAHAGSD